MRSKKLLIVLGLIFMLVIFGLIKILPISDPVFIHVYHYESSDRGFKDLEVPEKGRTLEMVEAAFKDYIIATGKRDIELRITDKNERRNIWEWKDSFHRRWKYRYMKPSR